MQKLTKILSHTTGILTLCVLVFSCKSDSIQHENKVKDFLLSNPQQKDLYIQITSLTNKYPNWQKPYLYPESVRMEK